MPILITKDDLPLYTNNIPFKCEYCDTTVEISQSDAYRHFKGTRIKKFCSKKCALAHKIVANGIDCNCLTCGVLMRKTQSQLNSKNNNFCSQSCSATFFNKKRATDRRITAKKCSCGNLIMRGARKFCSHKCEQKSINSQKISDWLAGLYIGYSGKMFSIRSFIRKYLIREAGNQCSKCGWNKIHSVTNKCPLEINHIDGNPLNERPSNLEVLCPNCHSLTYNFRSLNKNSPRKRK